MSPSRCRCRRHDGSGSSFALPPNNTPPWSSSAACGATARPPARDWPGSATRLETMTTLPLAFLMRRPSYGVLPWPAQGHGGDDQAHVRIGLREVAPQFAAVERQVLGQQAQVVPARQDLVEHRPRLVLATDGGQRVDVPEGADDEAGFGRTEVVGRDVAEQAVAALELAADGLDGGDEARVARLDEAQVGEQQQRGVQAFAAVGVGEMA